MSATEVYARFEYVCSHGHTIGADHPYRRCPLAWCGSEDLTRIGYGSRKAATTPREGAS